MLCVVAPGSAIAQAPGQAAPSSSDSNFGPSLDLPSYEAQLDAWSQAVAKAKHDPKEIARLRRSIPEELDVKDRGAEVHASTSWLGTSLSNLERNPKEADQTARRIERRLEAMRQAAQLAGAPRSEPSTADARPQLDKIFQRREFRGLSGPTEWQLLMQRISRWIEEQIYRLLRHLHINAKAGNFAAWVVIGIAFAVLLYWIIRRLIVLSKAAGLDDTPEQTPAISSREWLNEALAAAERRDYREAIHCSYWASITRLEDSGILARERSRTPRESLRQLDANPNEQKPLRELTRRFELVWYGYRPASADDWAGARTQLEQIGCLKASTAATASS